jgi:hypothetical protein
MTADSLARWVQRARSVETHTAHTNTDTLIRALDAAERMPAAAQLRARSYQLLQLPPGALAPCRLVTPDVSLRSIGASGAGDWESTLLY